MISQPLELERMIKTRPETSLEVVPIVDILIIVVFFGLFSSPFVMPQGIEHTLSVDQAIITGVDVSAVLTVKRDNMLLFEGANLKLDQFEPKAREFLENKSQAILLVRMDPHIKMETYLNICAQARRAGFVKVHVAAEEKQAELPTFQ